jgi:hypothetical protein
LTGIIDGGGGTNTITGDNNGDSFAITGVNAGSITTLLSAGFSDIQNLVGGSGNDSFTFVTGASLTGTIKGGGGVNTITGDNAGDSFSITGANAGSIATLLSAAFSNIQNLVGGSGNDSFTFVTGGSLTGTIKGSGGINTITGDNASDSFSITGANAGSITTLLPAGFSNIQNLVGGTGNDSFTFTTSGSLSGTIDGASGTDGLNVAGNVTLTGSANTTTETGYAGTNGSISGGFRGIDTLHDTGTGSDTLTDVNATSTWALGATETYNDGQVTLTFSGYKNLQGGTGADTFNVAAAITANVTIDGGGGTNTLNVDDSANTTSTAYVLNASSIGLPSSLISYSNIHIVGLTLGTPMDGAGGNTVNVEGIPAGATMDIAANGNSHFFLGGLSHIAPTGSLIISTSSTTDTVTVDDSQNSTATSYTINPDTGVNAITTAGLDVTLVGTGGGDFFSKVVVDGGTGVNSYDVTPSANTVITVSDNNATVSSTLTYEKTASGASPVNDGVSSITDASGHHYQPVNYHGFAQGNIKFV